jgi:hypothetical protein
VPRIGCAKVPSRTWPMIHAPWAWIAQSYIQYLPPMPPPNASRPHTRTSWCCSHCALWQVTKTKQRQDVWGHTVTRVTWRMARLAASPSWRVVHSFQIAPSSHLCRLGLVEEFQLNVGLGCHEIQRIDKRIEQATKTRFFLRIRGRGSS